MRRYELVLTPLYAVMLTVLASASAAATNWLQFDFDPAHSGYNPAETTISASGTGPFAITTLFPMYHATLPAKADGAPAYLANVTTVSGIHDLLFLTTNSTNFTSSNTDNRLVAVDAATGTPVWASTPATGPNWTTSSPAIDPNLQYVYSYAVDGKVHKYHVGDGTEVVTSGWPEIATLKPDVEKGSAALAIATAKSGTSYLYVANGGYPGDAGDYQGHVTAINLATGAQKIFNANCSDQTVHFVESATPDCAQVQTAIWARPGVIYSAATDHIYMATGNGPYDANQIVAPSHDWGDSVFELAPDASGSGGLPLDSYTPSEYQTLQNNDADLGSTAPALLPAPATSNYQHLAVQGGKDSQLRLLNLDNLSGASGPGHIGGELQKIAVPQGGEVLPQPAVWIDSSGTTWVFVTTSNGIAGLRLVIDGIGNPSLSPVWNSAVGGSSPVVANGVLYYFSGSMNALDPTTGNGLWSDSSPGGVHWESPIVVNGHIYVTDENGELWAYALDGIFRDGFE